MRGTTLVKALVLTTSATSTLCAALPTKRTIDLDLEIKADQKGLSVQGQLVVKAFELIAAVGTNIQLSTENINFITAPFEGQNIGQGFDQLVATLDVQTALLNGPILHPQDANGILLGLNALVQVHHNFVAVVVTAQGVHTLLPFYHSIHDQLIVLQARLDSLATVLVRLVPTAVDDIEGLFAGLRVSITAAVNLYAQVL